LKTEENLYRKFTSEHSHPSALIKLTEKLHIKALNAVSTVLCVWVTYSIFTTQHNGRIIPPIVCCYRINWFCHFFTTHLQQPTLSWCQLMLTLITIKEVLKWFMLTFLFNC